MATGVFYKVAAPKFIEVIPVYDNFFRVFESSTPYVKYESKIEFAGKTMLTLYAEFW